MSERLDQFLSFEQVLERIVDEISYTADDHASQEFKITKEYVQERVKEIMVKSDLTRYVL